MDSEKLHHSTHPAIDDAIDPEKGADRNASIVAEKILQHSHDADAALAAFASHQGQLIEIDPATNRRLLRIIDMHLMPVRNHQCSLSASIANQSLK